MYHSQHREFRSSHHQFSMIRNGYHSNFNRLILSIQFRLFSQLSAVHEGFVDLVVEKVDCAMCFPNKVLRIEIKVGSIRDARC